MSELLPLETLTVSDFADRVGTAVTLLREDGGSVLGTLRSAQARPGSTSGRSFTLVLWAAGDPLPQGLRGLEFAGFGACDVFVSPFAHEAEDGDTGAQGTLYEVVFSRAD